MKRPKLSDILSGSISDYLEDHKLSYKQLKVISKIINCFSENAQKLFFKCSNKDCDYSEYKNKPCGDRHCNRCNNNKKLKWVMNLIREFLPLPYYHLVFTLPEELRNLAICNQKIIYDLLFKSSFYVLKKFGKDKKYFGGKIGFIGLLHTWGQTLNYHPHLHYIVLAGGIVGKNFKRLPYQEEFIFPVKALSKVMMGKFIDLIKAAYRKGELAFPGVLENISSSKDFSKFIFELGQKEWVTYSKKPMPNSNRVLEYISRYTHKVAISNNRIKSYTGDKVTFEYKDYKDIDSNKIPKKKLMTLSDTEFIRRFLLHILPNKFRKIRYGGIFSSNQKAEAFKIIRKCLGKFAEKLDKEVSIFFDEMEKILRKFVCPLCSGKLLFQESVMLSGFI